MSVTAIAALAECNLGVQVVVALLSVIARAAQLLSYACCLNVSWLERVITVRSVYTQGQRSRATAAWFVYITLPSNGCALTCND